MKASSFILEKNRLKETYQVNQALELKPTEAYSDISHRWEIFTCVCVCVCVVGLVHLVQAEKVRCIPSVIQPCFMDARTFFGFCRG